MKAPVTIAIDDLLSKHIAPFLKEAGFRKKAQRFWRNAGPAIQLVELGRWKYNEGSAGKFEVSVGIFFPEVWQMVRGARPGWGESFDDKYPPIQNCINEQFLLPKAKRLEPCPDQYWDIFAGFPLDEQATEVLSVLSDEGLPWLERHSTLKDNFSRLLELSNKKDWISSVYLFCAAALEGEKSLAAEALAKVLAPKVSLGFPDAERKAFKMIAASYGVEFAR